MTHPPGRSGPRKGFTQAGGLVQTHIRKASEGRGFAVTRLLTHWAETVGPDLAALAVPVRVGYGRTGLGATLTVLAKGARAPLVEARKEELRSRVNACYGYNAIARVRITQTAATGFAEEPDPFAPASGPSKALSDKAVQEARELAKTISDPELRQALEELGSRILDRSYH